MGFGTMFDLSGKHALVVGDGKVPFAVVALFREAGAKVTHVEDIEPGERQIADLFAQIRDLDILVNGLIRTGPWTIDSLTMEEWDKVHAHNARGAYLMMREAVRVMRAHGRGGRLINLSTIGSVHPVLNGNFAYGSSRAATNALTRQFALDFCADGITSNCILVGPIQSDAFPQGVVSPPTGPGATLSHMPMGLGRPEDVAPTALLLAGEGGRYITGQAIAVDGGFLIA